MKLKKDYVLRQAAGAWVVLPLGEEAVNFSGMLKLNDSGVMLWKVLEQGGDKNTASRSGCGRIFSRVVAVRLHK